MNPVVKDLISPMPCPDIAVYPPKILTSKRSINHDEEMNASSNMNENEFMPVTKRMTNLTIHNPSLSSSSSSPSSSSTCSSSSCSDNSGSSNNTLNHNNSNNAYYCDENDSTDSEYQYSNNLVHSQHQPIMTNGLSFNDNSNRQPQSSSSSSDVHSNDLMYLNEIYRDYNPSLTLDQNPIYYDANRILYEAHKMRMIRIQSMISNNNVNSNNNQKLHSNNRTESADQNNQQNHHRHSQI